MIKSNEYGLVKIKIPGLNGPRIVTGKVTKIIPPGGAFLKEVFEIRTQMDGYHIVKESDILQD